MPAERPVKARVAVIAGGQNCEHEVSLASAAAVALALEHVGYQVVRLTIGADGTWHDSGVRLPGLAGEASRIFVNDRRAASHTARGLRRASTH